MKGFHTTNNDTTDLGEDWAAELLEPHIEYSYEQLKEQVRTEEKLGLKAKGKAEINYFEMPRK